MQHDCFYPSFVNVHCVIGKKTALASGKFNWYKLATCEGGDVNKLAVTSRMEPARLKCALNQPDGGEVNNVTATENRRLLQTTTSRSIISDKITLWRHRVLCLLGTLNHTCRHLGWQWTLSVDLKYPELLHTSTPHFMIVRKITFIWYYYILFQYNLFQLFSNRTLLSAVQVFGSESTTHRLVSVCGRVGGLACVIDRCPYPPVVHCGYPVD